MNELARAMLPYRGGYLALTDSRLLVVRDGYLAESWALCHLSSVSTEQAQSFRHRLCGLVVAMVLLAPSLALLPVDLPDSLALLAMFRGKLGIGILFSAFFGVFFLWGVITSRRIWWLCASYAKMRKSVPLPGVDPSDLDRFVQLLECATEN